MDSKTHAGKLPTQKTHKAAREAIRIKYRFPSSASDGTVGFRREKTKIAFPKQTEKSLSGTKLAEKVRKR